MRRCLSRLWVLGIAVVSAFPAAAQSSLVRQTLYKLDRDSSMQRGCFPPCMCPIMAAAPVTGTLRLVPAGNNGLFDVYEVRDVNWKTSLAGESVRISGSGTYEIGGEFALEHHLALDLTIGSEPPQHFESVGRLSPPSGFPRIDIQISIHGGYCFDTVIDLHARPARMLHVERVSAWWDPEPEPAQYDVMRGELQALRAGGGAFEPATEGCLLDDSDLLSLSFSGTPQLGDGFWFLVCVEGDTCDSGSLEQFASRDAQIRSSPASCP